jgi:hypothetical protein
MVKRRKTAGIIVMLIVLVASGPMVRTAFTRQDGPPKPPDKLTLGQDEVRKLLLLIGPDKNGRISKVEWMKFMEAEFDRLDKTRSGVLDLKELAQPTPRVMPFSSMGK